MNTKYVKVHVSERLPEKSGFYVMFVKNNPIPVTKYFAILGFNNNLEYWLEPALDHSEEMLSILEDVRTFFQPHPHFALTDDQESTLKQIEQLINKVKDNGI